MTVPPLHGPTWAMVSPHGQMVWEVLRWCQGRQWDVLPTPFAERVLDLVATIPPGRVLTYGDVAERVGSRAPRAVGTTLARFGGGVPWWRVVRAGGFLAPGHEVSATEHLVAEGVEVLVSANGPRVDLTGHRWTTDA